MRSIGKDDTRHATNGVENLTFAASATNASVTVYHGLGQKPRKVLVSPMGTGGPSPPVLQVDSISNTTFRIYGEWRSGTVGSQVTISAVWEAIA